MPLDKELQKIGLSDKESKVYLAALELGQASVQNIARKADVNRATTYSILEALIKKGLCSTTEKEKKVFYFTSPPESLLSIFELKRKQMETEEDAFKNLLPDLNSIFNKQADKPTVRFFDGRQGLLNSVAEFYREKSEPNEPVRMLYNKDLIEKVIDEKERQKFRKIRLSREIKSKVIYNYETGVLKTNVDGQRRKVNLQEYPISCDIEILGDAVLFVPLTDKLHAVLIKDRQIAETIKILYNLAWLGAEIKEEKE